MNIAEHIASGSRLCANKIALCFEEQRYTYAELHQQSSRATHVLHRAGIAQGDRVALLLENSPSFVIAYLGIQKVGAIAVSINPALTSSEIQFILQDSEASLLITDTVLSIKVTVADLPTLRQIALVDLITLTDLAESSFAFEAEMAQADEQWLLTEMSPDAPATLIYTSGTTGFPKGVTLSHNNIVSNARMCQTAFDIQPDDRVLLCLPIYQSYGQNGVLNSCFEAQATLILQRSFAPEATRETIRTYAVTHFPGIPTMFMLLLEVATPAALRSLRVCISSAVGLPLTVAEQWQATYGLVINEEYGQTETLGNTYNHQHRYKPGSIGTPFAGLDVTVVDEASQPVTPGALGEIVVSGPSVMVGYWRRPAETAQVIRAGRFHTGDVGYVDEEGYLYLVGRLRDLINVGGQKVAPSEVENILYQHPAIAEAAVYGVPAPFLGEQVWASVVLRPGQSVTPADLLAFCQQHLARSKVPVHLEVVGALPKGPTGKILKRRLLEQAQSNVTPIVDSRAPALSPTALLPFLCTQVAQLLKLAEHQLVPNQSLITLGLDSLTALTLHHWVQCTFQVDLPVAKLLTGATLAELAQWIAAQTVALPANASAVESAVATPLVTTEQPVTTNQRVEIVL